MKRYHYNHSSEPSLWEILRSWWYFFCRIACAECDGYGYHYGALDTVRCEVCVGTGRKQPDKP